MIKTLIKYDNRKIYYPEESKYVNLSWIRRAIKKGFEVKVVTHSTKRDVTNEVLSQLISKSKVSSETLMSLIRW